MYYVGLAIAVVVLAAKYLLPFVQKGIKLFGSFHRNPSEGHLTPDQLRAMQVGAVHGEQNSFYYNSLETGIPANKLAQMLVDGWGIRNSGDAHETIAWLLGEGHRIFFPGIYSIIQTEIDPQSAIPGSFPEESLDTVFEFYDNLKGAMNGLAEDIQAREQDYERGVLAWDISRVALLARSCSDCGYISSNEAWQYIFQADAMAQETFSDWRELRNSLVIGRAMWNGYGNHLNGFISISNDLLTGDKSPWNIIPFRGK
jgi:hypothetical protein